MQGKIKEALDSLNIQRAGREIILKQEVNFGFKAVKCSFGIEINNIKYTSKRFSITSKRFAAVFFYLRYQKAFPEWFEI